MAKKTPRKSQSMARVIELEPAMKADLDRLIDRVHREMSLSEIDKPMRVVLEVPAHWATLAAWVHRRLECHYGHTLGPHDTDIGMPPMKGDREAAREMFREWLGQKFWDEFGMLYYNTAPYLEDIARPLEHPVLGSMETSSQRRSLDDDEDIEIPF